MGFLIFSLCITAIIIMVVRRVGIRLAYIWFSVITVLAVILIFTSIIAVENIQPIAFKSWYSINQQSLNLIFQIDSANATLIKYFLILTLSFFLTDVTRLQGDKSVTRWVLLIIKIAVVILIFSSGNMLSLLIGWVLIDAIDIFLEIIRRDQFSFKEILIPSIRKFAGIFLLMVSVLFETTRIAQIHPIFQSLTIGRLIILGSFFHATIYPWKEIPSISEPSKRSLHLFSACLSIAASSAPLLVVSKTGENSTLGVILAVIFTGIALYNSIRWFLNETRKWTDPLFIKAIVALIGFVASASESPQILPWIVFLSSLTALPAILSSKFANIKFFHFGVLFSLVGFPLSLINFSERVFLGNPSFQFFVPIILILAFLIAGMLDQPWLSQPDIPSEDPWYKMFFMIGSMMIPLGIILSVWNSFIQFSSEISRIWLSAIVIGLVILLRYAPIKKILFSYQEKARIFIDRSFFKSIKNSFKSLPNRLWKILTITSDVNTQVFEKEGGFLWAIVIFALFITLLRFEVY